MPGLNDDRTPQIPPSPKPKEVLSTGGDAGAGDGEGVANGPLDRRRFLAWAGGMGLGGTLLPGVLWARMQEAQEVTAELLADAERVAGLEFTPEEREMMLEDLQESLGAYEAIRATPVPNSVPPALHFDPNLPGGAPEPGRGYVRLSAQSEVERPGNLEEVAFWPVTRLSELVRTGQVTARELTEMYLDRLERHGPTLECVVTLTAERALQQADTLDRELAAGRWRGPLHGIPWGAKDLLAVAGYPTTWGARPYQEQTFDEDATVVQRLDEAGAVLVAKLTLGALAWGDVWFGGRTRNPWNLEQGSSGSSAGSAAATAAGLVGFSIGSETLGSIVSPSTRCGATGLRPTFGRVSRHGAMALSWSMDKLGPICRSVEDCAVVLGAIHGADDRDPSARDVSFRWDGTRGLEGMRVGYLRSAFEAEHATRAFDDAALEVLRSMGVDLHPVEMPSDLPVGALRLILTVEGAAAFNDLTLEGRDDEMVRQIRNAWPNVFRQARLVPAVEYVQANRIRTMLMGQVERALAEVDAFVTPSFGGGVLQITNLTGQPTVVVPNGFDEGSPVSISFLAPTWRDDAALRLARAYQEATDFHRRQPPAFAV